MIDFTAPSKDFKKALRIVLAGRAEFSDQDTADFTVRVGEVHLCSTGTETSFQASIAAAGYARVSIPVLKRMRKIGSSFKQDSLRVRIERQRVRIESFGFTSPDVELKPFGPRIADVPIDATVLDLLALQKLYSAEEIADSGLAARVAEAQETLIANVDSAHRALSQLNVNRVELRNLVERQIVEHASRMKLAMTSGA
jgi:hypothetical protein